MARPGKIHRGGGRTRLAHVWHQPVRITAIPSVFGGWCSPWIMRFLFYLQFKHVIPAPVDWTSASAWLYMYKHT